MRIERMMRAGVMVLGVVGALPLAAQQGMVPGAEVAAPLAPATAQVNEAYDTATVALDRGDYGRAIELFSDIANQKGDRADAALYWVAYAQQRQGDGAGAINSIGVLRREFPDSAWLDDADHLVAEIRGARGDVGDAPRADRSRVRGRSTCVGLHPSRFGGIGSACTRVRVRVRSRICRAPSAAPASPTPSSAFARSFGSRRSVRTGPA